MPIQSVNPANGTVLRTYNPLTETETVAKIERSETAFRTWRETSLAERSHYMQLIATQIRRNSEDYAQLLTAEMGKPIAQARAEVEKSATNFDHYSEMASTYLAPRSVSTDASESYVQYDPLGVILMVMPWNYAFWQVLRMAAPILMAGNTALLKHASNVPQAALAIEQIMTDAGLPEGVFQTLLIGAADVEKVIENDEIKGVSLTGSEHAGSLVGAQAGRLIKPVVLELGGSDPSLILEDADVELACTTAATSRLQNNGQSCISSKRFIVHEAVYDEVLKQLVTIFESYTVGDPSNEKTQLGPVVSEQALDELLSQIKASVAAGAKIAAGGSRLDQPGFFLAPTILTDVTPDVPSYHEELFGPVVSVIKVKSDDEAVKVANDTRFGLGASIYTKDLEHAKRLIPRIESGSVFVNGLVKSDPRLPFGGTKKSGIGRELSEEGIRAFTNIKTVWIK